MRGKKILAVLMTATMVMAMSITAFADENSGGSEGAGASEGHVEKKATSVILPTVPTDGEDTVSPYRYTMDPERLITNTNHGKYDNVIYPEATDDKGVYFNNGKKGGDGEDKDYVVYTNTSDSQKVTNKSSHDIALTVTAEAVATDGGTDIPLVAQTALATATDASLYLGLVVGSGEGQTKTAVASDAAASKTVTLAGTAANYKVAAKADKSGYEYRVLTLEEYKGLEGNSGKTQDDFDATWANTTFAIEGECTSGKEIASTTTAPKLKVTWSWVDPTANAGPSISPSEYTIAANTNTEITVNLGLGDLAATSIESITYKNANNQDRSVATTDYSFANGKLTINKSVTDSLLTIESFTSRVYTVTFDNDATATFTLKKQ